MGIEQSVLLADPRGPQVTSQVVLSGMMGEARDVRVVWNLEKTSDETEEHPLIDPNEAPDVVPDETPDEMATESPDETPDEETGELPIDD